MMNSEWVKKNLKPIIFYMVFFLFIFAFSTCATNYDYDFWARLIAGMGLVQTGHVLKQDFLSYTPTHIWFDHEWGSGVIFYLVHHFFSNAGILFLQVILIFLTFFFVSKTVELRKVKTTSAYNFLFYYFSFITINYIAGDLIRCQLFSFLFFAVFLYILELARNGKNKPLWLLPIIMIFWNNVHGGCVSGIGLIVLYIAGEIINRKPVKKYILPFVLTVLVLPINPWGFEYLKFLFKANTMQRADIVEWWGLFSKYFVFEYLKFKFYALVLVMIEVSVVLRQLIKKNFEFDKTKFLVLAVTLYLAIAHVKLIPFAVIAMICFVYDDFYSVFNFITRNIFNKIAIGKDIVIYGLILIFAFSHINKSVFDARLDWAKYPILPIEFIRINEIKGNLLTNFGLGSYAGYKLYPNNKIFTDGRYEEVYYEDLMILLGNFYRLKPGWDEILKKYPPDVILIEKMYPVSAVLLRQKEWRAAFEDNNFLVFVRADKIKKSYKRPSDNIEYYKKTLFDTDIKFVLQSKHER